MNNQQAYDIMQIKATAFDEIVQTMDSESSPANCLMAIAVTIGRAEMAIEKVGD